MFKTKLEVDRHVDNSLKRINNETERNLRCFSFAKLYFNVGDYEQACRYVSSYLAVKPKSAEGHHLLGKCLQNLGKKEAALEAYRTSLQLDPKQNNLVIKVCELLASDDVDMDQNGARYFCDLAQSVDPHNPAVFSLKERLISTECKNPSEISQLLLQELESRPTDVNLRVRLLKHFLQNNMIKEAYKHASDIEEKNISIFHNHLSWYEVFAEVLVRFQRDLTFSSQLTWEFWFRSVSVLDRLVALSLDEHLDTVKTSNEYVNAVFNFDQMLSKAAQNISSCPDRTLVQVFLNHYQAQLYSHLATLTFKQAKKNLIGFKEASNITLPVLLAAYHAAPPDLQGMWLNNSPENRRNLVNRWYKEASFRCSQTGHILISAAKDRKSVLMEKATHYSTGMWREQLFKKLFVSRDQQLKINTSYFVASGQSLEPVMKLPEVTDLIKYDEVAQLVFPDSLHHHIWIALNNKLVDYEVKSFEGLQYTIKNLSNCAAESINVLDIQSFIYCATLCAQSKLEDTKNLLYYNQDKASVLPVAITENLGTLNQSKFLTAAYKMFKNEPDSNMGELRLLLIRGIEVIRCVGHHGLDVKLLVTIANIFAERATKLTKHSEIEANDARAELYWKTALPLLEKIKNNQVITYSTNRLFELKSKEYSINEVPQHIEKGKLFTGVQLMKKKEYEKALHIFDELKDPYASFHQSQIYKLMADQKTNQNKENVTSEMRSQNIILLSRSRDCLYLTLDRLREPSVDRNHPLNVQLGTEIEKIERLLSRIDPDCNNRNECDGMSDENVSSDNSAGDHYLTTYTTHNSFHNGQHFTPKHDSHNNHSTPLRFNITRQEARPSPERLDAQLRQLAASKDLALNNILEQNKIMVDSHRSLLEELRSFRDAVNNLTATVDDLKTMKSGLEEIKDVKKSVDQLRNSVDQLQNAMDIVQEMKKEISELKKDQQKNNQLSDEDLYVLDPDYNSALDYNINANLTTPMGAFSNAMSGMYPHYQGARLPNPASTLAAAAYGAPGLYPGLYPGLAYAYGGLGLPQAGTLPFVPDQQLPQIASLPPQPTQNFNQPPINSNLGMAFTGQPLSHTIIPPKISPKTAVTTPSIFSSATSVALPQTIPSTKAAPVNVVITSSDPLPTNRTPTIQPVLSVTIPPQHIKGNVSKVPLQSQPHNYQIPLPTTNTICSTPSILNKPSPVISTQSLLSSVSPPAFSAVSQSRSPRNVSLGLQIEKTLEQTFNSSKNDTSLNRSNVSTSSVEEHDPCPDFKPIIPLPDEVQVNTGEENETELFCERAKLFRHVSNNGVKEWKERGIGNLKILLNPQTGKVRVLMRRDQVHKICANHFLTKDMTVTPMANNDRAYVWAAHDFADEEVVLEKFCVRFKTAEEAKKFYNKFEEAKKKILDDEAPAPAVQPSSKAEFKVHTPKTSTDTPKAPTSLGGFSFSSTPTFKPKDVITPTKIVETKEETQKVTTSPFASFTFTSKPASTASSIIFSSSKPEATKFSPLVISQSTPKSATQKTDNDDSHAEDFVPTAEFKPVIALPEIVNIQTGEENAEVLFAERAKLFRYDTSGEVKEWKERGIGVMKVLKEDEKIRLLMRRDQVHKVCCNHQVFKDMAFKQNTNNTKTVVWHAQDFSEGVLKPETLTVRFKTEEQASNFLKVLQSNQANLDENSQVSSKHHKAEKVLSSPKSGFGDKFKAAKGSWGCKNCYIVNEGKTNHCIACETPKSGASPKKTDESGAAFSFGVKPLNQGKTDATGWGSAFKPAEGTWECKSCYIRNPADKDKCLSCETPKAGASASSKPMVHGVNLETPGQKFTFGVPAEKKDTKQASTGFGDTFKPKEGTWECKTCYIRNPSDKHKCLSCETPKDGSAAPKQPLKSINLETPGLQFNFGIPAAQQVEKKEIDSKQGFGNAFKPSQGTWECKVCYIRNEPSNLYCLSCENPKDDTVPKKEPTKGVNLDTPGQKFTFGIPAATGDAKKNFSFGDASTFSFTPTTAAQPIKNPGKFVFGSPQQHEFEFKPRSPRRISSGQGDESDGSYVEEEEDNIYFKPVIPLPDKVEVKTGEEEECVLYCHRAKLFRFVNGEWKERGIGDIKVLKRQSTGKLRVVMRREQVLKICLNHVLTKDIEYIKKDEKTWLFHAADYSEGEISHEQFCVRFKNAEIAQEFKNVISAAVNNDGDRGKKGEEESDDDVEIVSETKVTPEEEQEAIKLGLPPKFFSYRQLPDCTCEQCKKDDEYLKELFNDGKKSITTDVTPVKTPASIFTTPKPSDIKESTPKEPVFTFTPTPTEPKSETLKDLLQKPSPIASSTVTKSIFDAEPSGTPKTGFSFSKPGIFNTSSQSPFGGTTNNPTGSVFSPSNTNLFSSSSSSIFGSSSATSSPGSLFSTMKTTPSSGSIFGSAQSTTSSTGNLNVSTASNTTVFGGSTTSGLFGSTPTSGTSIFGGTATTGSIFSGNATKPSIFGSSTNTTPTSATVFGVAPSTTSSASLFGAKTSSIFSTPTTGSTATTTSSIFGGFSAAATTTGTLFGTKIPFGKTGTLFGSKTDAKPSEATLSFGSVAKDSTLNLKETDDLVLKCDSDVTFASLASKADVSAPPAFAKTDKNGGETPFSFLGAGAPVFGSATKKDTKKADKSKNESDDEGDDQNEEHDPHFEPIVPLPDAIVVSTGEENETVMFNERAKLFRFDTNTREWKERGVGQMKILYHPENNTYRMLLRREQVHKLVLNQLVIPELDIQPMSTSDKAWVWAGYNYTDDENNLEKLAVRFKNFELAQTFKKVIDNVIVQVTEIQNNRTLLPATVQNYGLEDISGEEHTYVQQGEEEEEEEDDDDEDDDDRTVMFMKRCTLSEQTPDGSWKVITMGDLQVYYDPELYAARISVTDDDDVVRSNTLIGMNTLMDIERNECKWKAVEWADGEMKWKNLKATFSSDIAAQEFHSNYLEGVNYAQEVGIIDEIS